MRRFLIDTDTASDDAVALVMAAMNPNIQVEAITVVAGNVPLEQGVQNALYTIELCGKDIPVYGGCAKPILRPLATAQNVHGNDGMGDIGLPLKGRQPADGHAIDVLIETIRKYPGEITLVTLGPLTNVAVAVLRDPKIAGLVKDCVMMGGIGSEHGNVTPTAEFNIWCDPEAAKIVFESGMPITMVGWDISWKYAVLDDDEAAEIRGIGTALAEFVVDIQAVLVAFCHSETQLPGFDLPDPIAMAIAIDPTLAEVQEYYVVVTIGDDLHRGQTVIDKLGMLGNAANTRVVKTADRARFIDLLRASLV